MSDLGNNPPKLTPEEELDVFGAVKNVLWKRLDKTKYKAFVYGSRARGTARKFSDIDVGIMGEKRLDLHTLAALDADFEESDLPYLVEVVDFKMVSKDFEKSALKSIVDLN